MATNARWRFALAGAMVPLGVALLVYGVWFHSATVQAEAEDGTPAVVASEPSLIKEVTIGGLERDDSGEISKTYGDDEAPPKACPT